MRRVTYLEIDLPRCANTYSVSPCRAYFGVATESGWDTDRHHSSVTISANLCRATQISGTNFTNVFTAEGSTEPRRFTLEFADIDDNPAIGVANGSASFGGTNNTEFLGWDNNSIGFFSNGNIRLNGAVVDTMEPFVEGDTIECAFNPITGLVWFRHLFQDPSYWNDSATADPFLGLEGIDISALGTGPLYGAATLSDNGEDIDLDFDNIGTVPTGTDKCTNCFASCQDPANFNLTTQTVRFAVPASYLRRDIDALPNIIDVEHTPATVSLGDNLGERATLKVTFKDEPHSDTGDGYDPYYAERFYDPWGQGTHWGKFRARYPFLQGSDCRLYRGDDGDDIDDMEVRYFIIESTEGPDADGRFSIIAKDMLKLLDGDRAQAPGVSSGRLISAITDSDTSATLTPTGIGNDEYPTGAPDFYACIGGKEIVKVTSRAGDVLTIQRGMLNTEAVAHEGEERVQVVLAFEGEDVADIINELITTYSVVDSDFVPIDDWLTETGLFLNSVYTGYVTEPTPVKDLISELIEQAGLVVWWSDDPPQINLQVLRPVASSADTIDKSIIVKDSFSVEDQPEKRVTQSWTFFGQRDPTRPVDEESNYRQAVATIDSDAEANAATSAIRKIYSRWISLGGQTAAERVNDLILARYAIAPRKFEFKLFSGGSISAAPAVGYQLSMFPLQDVLGAAETVPIQVRSVKSEDDGEVIVAEEFDSEAPVGSLTDDFIIISSDDFNINLRDVHDQLYPEAIDGDRVICYIQSGVIIGSTSASEAAFEVGSFASGVDVYVIVYGRIQGCGGQAGGGGDAGSGTGFAEDGGSGSDGGTAFFTDGQAVFVDASLGEIWGGGGGGGGGGGAGDSGGGTKSGGGGGGGGAGTVSGQGDGGGDGAGGGGQGKSGDDGSSESGGDGGNGATGGLDGGDGGNGGDPGQDGQGGHQGQGDRRGQGGDGGDAGNSVDGDSMVQYGVWDEDLLTFTNGVTGTEDIRGPEIN